ncbi:MAG: class II glutamine amidotransferase [Bradymonadaceae bacterium]
MSRMIGYLCNDDSLTPRVVQEVAGDLSATDDAESDDVARGFGWIRDGQPLLRKHPPQGANHTDMAAILADIQAREIVGYECTPERATVETQDLQPFSYRSWVYAQDGAGEVLQSRRDEILDSLPDHIRRHLDGNAPSELGFHLFLAAMQRREGFGLARREARDCAAALAETGSRIEQLRASAGEVETPQSIDAVTVSDRLLMAWSGRGDLYVRKFDGIESPDEEPLFAGHDPESEEHPHFRAFLVVSAEAAPGEDWRPVGQGEVLWVGDDWEVHSATAEAFDDV